MSGHHGPDAARDPEPSISLPGRNCWRIERADRLSVIVDAADYFAAVREAMLRAEKRIMLIGWDFDGRVHLGRDRSGGAPPAVGPFILWLADRRPDLEIYVLRWDIGVIKSLARGTTPLTFLRWTTHKRIHFRLDGAHPLGGSHHQKIVVIDDCLAFCGGIDITSRRWDTREHRDDDPRRISPGGKHHDPWHDATLAFNGPAAAAIGQLARQRWTVATEEALAAVPQSSTCWPDRLQPDFTNVGLAISRTIAKYGPHAGVQEIEAQTIDLIARARRCIYAETQYFASRKLAEAVARRLAEPDGPEIVLINPEQADGWLEQEAMDTARARLVEALRNVDTRGRFRIYHPFTPKGVPIYVHAKITIVDDHVLRVGSSNWNNRSLHLDSECDILIDAALADDPEGASKKIVALRDGLLGEHLAVDAEVIAKTLNDTNSLIATIEKLAGTGKTLRPYRTPNLTAVEKYLADNQVLDPEGPEEPVEPIARQYSFRRFRKPL